MNLNAQLILESERIIGNDVKIKIRKTDGTIWYGQGKYLYPVKKNEKSNRYSYIMDSRTRVERGSSPEFRPDKFISYTIDNYERLLDNSIDPKNKIEAAIFMKEHPSDNVIKTGKTIIPANKKITIKNNDKSMWYKTGSTYYRLDRDKDTGEFSYNSRTSEKITSPKDGSFSKDYLSTFSPNRLNELLNKNIDPTNSKEIREYDKTGLSKKVSKGTEYKKKEPAKIEDIEIEKPKEEKPKAKPYEGPIAKAEPKKEPNLKDEENIPTGLSSKALSVLNSKDYRIQQNPSYTVSENRKRAFDEVESDFNLLKDTIDGLSHLYTGKNTDALRNLIPLFAREGKMMNIESIKREFPKDLLSQRADTINDKNKEARKIKVQSIPLVGKLARAKERADEDALRSNEGLKESIFSSLNDKEDDILYKNKKRYSPNIGAKKAVSSYVSDYDRNEDFYSDKMNSLIKIYRKRLNGLVSACERKIKSYDSVRIHLPARDENVFFEDFGKLLNNIKSVLKKLSGSGNVILNSYRDLLKSLYLEAKNSSKNEKFLSSREGEVLRKRNIIKTTKERAKAEENARKKSFKDSQRKIANDEREDRNYEKDSLKMKAKIANDAKAIEREKDGKTINDLMQKVKNKIPKKDENDSKVSLKDRFKNTVSKIEGKGYTYAKQKEEEEKRKKANKASYALDPDELSPKNLLQLAKNNLKK